jgi:hypothetical protein
MFKFKTIIGNGNFNGYFPKENFFKFKSFFIFKKINDKLKEI